MRQKNACVIRRLPIRDTSAVRSDPEVAGFLEEAAEALGETGRFVLKLSGIPQENRVLAEGESEEACIRWTEDFIWLLRKKGYYGAR